MILLELTREQDGSMRQAVPRGLLGACLAVAWLWLCIFNSILHTSSGFAFAFSFAFSLFHLLFLLLFPFSYFVAAREVQEKANPKEKSKTKPAGVPGQELGL